jgi:hypothetical protein
MVQVLITSFSPKWDPMTYFWENAEWTLGAIYVVNHTIVWMGKPYSQQNVWLHLKVRTVFSHQLQSICCFFCLYVLHVSFAPFCFLILTLVLTI